MPQSLSTIQSALIAAVAQIAALAVTFGWLNTSREQVIINAAAAVFSVVFLVVNTIMSAQAAKVAVAQAAVSPVPVPPVPPAPAKPSRSRSRAKSVPGAE